MVEVALADAEREFFQALDELRVRYLMVGMGAAVLQGADAATVYIDVWFENRDDARLHQAAAHAGGVWIPGHSGMMPPMLGGEQLGDRLDVVLTPHGLGDFESEYRNARSILVDTVKLWVLPLERVIESKRAWCSGCILGSRLAGPAVKAEGRPTLDEAARGIRIIDGYQARMSLAHKKEWAHHTRSSLPLLPSGPGGVRAALLMGP
jgi:hypothetical protein